MANNFGRVNVSITASTGGLTAGLSRATQQLSGFQSANTATSSTLSALNATLDESGGLFSDIPGLFGGFAAALAGAGRAAGLASVGLKVFTLALRTLLIPLGIVSAILAPFKALSEAASSLDEGAKSARRFGMSFSTFQNLSQVADEAGVSVSQLNGLLTIMTRGLGNLANGSKSAKTAFASIGLTLRDLEGLSPERQFELISQRIMALPTAAERTAAAIAIFGRQGAAAMGLIEDAANGGISEIATLREQLGVNLTNAQVKGIEMMNDALGRLSLPLQGFINQFLAELAPAITTVSNLIVDFFAKNTAGWTIAKTLADGLVAGIRLIVGAVTVLTGVFQVFMALGSKIGQMFYNLFGVILKGVANVMASMADLARASGFDSLAESLEQGSRGAREMAKGASEMGEIYGQSAADSFNAGVSNITNPFAAFDAEFAAVQAEANAPEPAPGESVAMALRAASKELKALVVGTTEGESFRNMLARGGDPRLDIKQDAGRTADATERTADGVEDMADAMANNGIAVAAIMV